MSGYEDIEGNPRLNLLNNNYDDDYELDSANEEDTLTEDMASEPTMRPPPPTPSPMGPKSTRKPRPPIITQEPGRKRPPGQRGGPPAPGTPFPGYGGMPPPWGGYGGGMPGMPPGPMGPGGLYKRRGDRAPMYHSGWADGSDSDDERARDPSKNPAEAAFQAYIMVGMVVVVLGVIFGVKLWEFWYGKPDIPENRIEF